MKYTVIYHKFDSPKSRTRFSSKKRAQIREKFYQSLGFKTTVMSKNDYEAIYGPLNNPRVAFNKVTDMSLIGEGNHNGPPYYNCNHLVKRKAFIFAPFNQPAFK